MDLYEHCQFEGKKKIILILSGKGPTKEKWTKLARKRNVMRKWSFINTVWFEVEEFDKFLQCCDFGFSVDNSQSKLDLMYKVINLKSNGVPSAVFVYDKIIFEQIQHNFDGFAFQSKEECLSLIITFNFITELEDNFVNIDSIPNVKIVTETKSLLFDYQEKLKIMGSKYNLSETKNISSRNKLIERIQNEASNTNWSLLYKNKIHKILKKHK